MTFLAPGFLYASFAVAAAMVALHFIVTRQPRAAILPTARFVPDTQATAVATAPRPTDVPLMLLRVLLILAAGAGLARPVLTPSRQASARVILVDVSRSARDSTGMRDTVRSLYREGDAVVLFDSSTRLLSGDPGDSLGALRPSARKGNVSAALIAALRAGSSLRDRADSMELVIVSPFAKEELDAATDTIRTMWPGRARLVRVPSLDQGPPAAPGGLAFRGDTSDAFSVSAELARKLPTARSVVDRRDVSTARLATPAISGSVESARAEAVVEWPMSARPRGAVRRAVVDTIGGVMAMANQAIVIAAFERRWSYPPDSVRGAEVIARWADGDPAAIERADGGGCVRSIAIPVTPVGDFVIRTEFVRFVAALSGACVARTSLIPADPDIVAKLAGKGGLAPRSAFQPRTDVRSDLAPWLLALALTLAIAEVFVRRRSPKKTSVDANADRSASGEARAA
ncbi:MAG: BatA domain-containing protein [Gemmatimonadaceae bacterium]